MKLSFKSIALLIGVVFFHNFSVAQLGTLNSSTNPYIFIDLNAQKMVHVISTNQDLFSSDPELFKQKINIIFEPMVDFRRVGASVMGKKYYLKATKTQRVEFISTFKKSLLDTYASTLAQWGDQKIETEISTETVFDKVIDVNQNLIASNNIYPITYKVRKDSSGNWLIVNIIVNGVNLGLTFRNQFQALAIEHNEDIEEVTNNWISNAEI